MPDAECFAVPDEEVPIVVAQFYLNETAPARSIVRDDAEASLGLEKTGELVRLFIADARGRGDSRPDLGFAARPTGHLGSISHVAP
jgi:hypothetical protein